MVNIIMPLVIATVIPIIVLWMIYRLDLYKIGEFYLVLMCFIAGGICFVIAYLLNPIAVNLGLIDFSTMKLFSAPFLEELLKALFLLIVIRRPGFTYFVDGAIYGFSVGIGFAVFENYSYIFNSSMGLEVAVSRVISTNLIHASASALVGAAFGYARFGKILKRWVILISILFLSIYFHIGFNILVTNLQYGNGFILIGAASIVGISAVAIIIIIINRGLKVEKKWIEEKLGMPDRVTTGEVKVVQRITDLKRLIEPIEKRFGVVKADKIEKILYLQARLGILHKTAEKMDEQKNRIDIEFQINKIRSEMDILRKEVGIYAMLYLRNIFPNETSPVWQCLELSIIEQNNKQDKSGFDIWRHLENQLSKQEK